MIGEQQVLEIQLPRGANRQSDFYLQRGQFVEEKKRFGLTKVKESNGKMVMCSKALWSNGLCKPSFLQDLVELASQLCQCAKPDYVIAIMPENQHISTDKLSTSKHRFIIFPHRAHILLYSGFIWFHFLQKTPNTGLLIFPVAEFKGHYLLFHKQFSLVNYRGEPN